MMNADGSALTNLTNSPDMMDRSPVWSPDGNQIAFESVPRLGKGDNRNIYAMNIGSSSLVQLTNHPEWDESPSWSPDGSRVAFLSDRDQNGYQELYVINADGSGLTKLIYSPDWGVSDYAWHPNGGSIAFSYFSYGVSATDVVFGISVINTDGSGLTNLTQSSAWDSGASWSPDGSQIVFDSERNGDWDVYIMNTDGTGVTNITNQPGNQSGAVWSPDGTKIAFSSDQDGDRDIYLMNADGSGLLQITDNDADDYPSDWKPSWTIIPPSPTNTPIPTSTTAPTPIPPNTPIPPPTTVPTATLIPSSGRIAFSSDRDGNSDIYVMNTDGSGLTRLTNQPGNDGGPSWSPTGQQIAFHSFSVPNQNADIYVINLDGSGLTNLTNSPDIDLHPSWSPDGRHIAFVSEQHMYRSTADIYVTNLDGSGLINLTNAPEADRFPSWSPDGSLIAFEARRDGNSEIYVMNSDGSGPRNLTNHPDADRFPDWSPDGQYIVFESMRTGNWDIYVMNADGSGMRRLTNHPKDDNFPSWSPDGQHIVFESTRHGDANNEIYVIKVDGSGLTRLTNNPGEDLVYSSFSPDGQQLAFACERGFYEICTINIDGSGLTRLTNNRGIDWSPAWSPDATSAQADSTPPTINMPIPTPIVKRGLGIGWHEVQAVFTRLDMGSFVFEHTVLPDGTPRFLGVSQDRLDTLELRGPSDNIESVSLLTVFSAGDLSYNFKKMFYLLALLDVIVPEWDDREKWLTDSIIFSANGDMENTISYNGKSIRYEYLGGFVNLSVESK